MEIKPALRLLFKLLRGCQSRNIGNKLSFILAKWSMNFKRHRHSKKWSRIRGDLRLIGTGRLGRRRRGLILVRSCSPRRMTKVLRKVVQKFLTMTLKMK